MTFLEVLRFRRIPIKSQYSTKEKWQLGQILDEMLLYGTFPELVLSSTENFRENILKDYLDILIYKDLLERYKIENGFVVRYLIKRIISANTKQININKIYNDLKSLGIKVWKTSLYANLVYLGNIFFVKQLPNYFSEKWFKKVFLYNIGFRYTFNIEKDLGKNFENLVFLHLIKSHSDLRYKDSKWEIDFFIEKENLNIQVCYELYDENFDREIAFGKDISSRNILIVRENRSHLPIPEHIEVVDWLDYLLRS